MEIFSVAMLIFILGCLIHLERKVSQQCESIKNINKWMEEHNERDKERLRSVISQDYH